MGTAKAAGPEALRGMARAFRVAVEELAPFDQSFASLKNFPNGCCLDAVRLLARVLDRRFEVEGSECVCGGRPDDPYLTLTHCWLEIDGIIVDVTADQFEEVDDSVLVVESVESLFHKSFLDQTRSRYPKFWRLQEHAVPEYEASLAAIIEYMASAS